MFGQQQQGGGLFGGGGGQQQGNQGNQGGGGLFGGGGGGQQQQQGGGLFGGGQQQQGNQGGGGLFGGVQQQQGNQGGGGLSGGGNQVGGGGGGGLFGGGNQAGAGGGGGLFGGGNQAGGGGGGGLFGGGNQAGGGGGGGLFGGGNQAGGGGGAGGGLFGGANQAGGGLFGGGNQAGGGGGLFGGGQQQGNQTGGGLFGSQQQGNQGGGGGLFGGQQQGGGGLFGGQQQGNQGGGLFGGQQQGGGLFGGQQQGGQPAIGQTELDNMTLVGGFSKNQPDDLKSATDNFDVDPDIARRYQRIRAAYTNHPEHCEFKVILYKVKDDQIDYTRCRSSWFTPEEWEKSWDREQLDKHCGVGNYSNSPHALIPVAVIGYNGLEKWLQELQTNKIKFINEKTVEISHSIKGTIGTLRRTQAKIDVLYKNYTTTTNKILYIMQQVDKKLAGRTHSRLRERLLPDEEQLRDRLRQILAKLKGSGLSMLDSDPGELRQRLDDLHFTHSQYKTMERKDTRPSDKFLDQVYEHLKNQQNSLERLTRVVERDMRDIRIARHNLEAIRQRELKQTALLD